jgi:predicted PurR-regulated permease PerM
VDLHPNEHEVELPTSLAGFEPTPQQGTVPPDALILPLSAQEQLNETSDPSFGSPGRPFNRRSPFFIGFTGALGVAVAYVIVRGIADVASVLVVIGLALFIAVGLDPIITWLVKRGTSRGVATGVVTAVFVLIIAGFLAAAVPPLSHEVQLFIKDFPKYRSDIVAGKGWAGHLIHRLHLQSYVEDTKHLKLPIANGLLGAGRIIISLGVGAVSVVVLTIYFLIALPAIKKLWLGTIPRTRRERVSVLTDEVFDRVGGFMLGNLFTSLVSGLGTFIWLLIFGVKYPLLLGLFVALFDLIPMVGSTIAGVVVTLVALDRGLTVAIATGVFYIVYRFLEDYLLNPRVMKHTVQVSPGLTIVATLAGGALLGLIGALIAIPLAATARLLLDEAVLPRQNTR